jgi:E1A/CREB-binding protein
MIGRSLRARSEQREHFLKSQQQRLLLLRHASKCPAPVGQCKRTKFCGPMKLLLGHLQQCKSSPCEVEHCVSSRSVLAHYRSCEKLCPVCTPVRETMRRMQEVRDAHAVAAVKASWVSVTV